MPLKGSDPFTAAAHPARKEHVHRMSDPLKATAASLLGPAGPIARRLSGYETRPEIAQSLAFMEKVAAKLAS